MDQLNTLILDVLPYYRPDYYEIGRVIGLVFLGVLILATLFSGLDSET